MLGFITILPLSGGAPDQRALRAFPVAGALEAIAAAIALACTMTIGLSVYASALAATAVSILIGGGLHEDGLADTADGFGGGRDAPEKLAIMRDSTIGSYGAMALIVALSARIVLLGDIAENGGTSVACATLIAAGALSRAGMALTLMRLPPVRSDGLGHAFAGASGKTLAHAMLAAGLIALAMIGVVAGSLPGTIVAPLAAFIAAMAMIALARQQIGGQTGDVCGATQQVSLVATFAGIAATL